MIRLKQEKISRFDLQKEPLLFSTIREKDSAKFQSDCFKIVFILSKIVESSTTSKQHITQSVGFLGTNLNLSLWAQSDGEWKQVLSLECDHTANTTSEQRLDCLMFGMLFGQHSQFQMELEKIEKPKISEAGAISDHLESHQDVPKHPTPMTARFELRINGKICKEKSEIKRTSYEAVLSLLLSCSEPELRQKGFIHDWSSLAQSLNEADSRALFRFFCDTSKLKAKTSGLFSRIFGRKDAKLKKDKQLESDFKAYISPPFRLPSQSREDRNLCAPYFVQNMAPSEESESSLSLCSFALLRSLAILTQHKLVHLKQEIDTLKDEFSVSEKGAMFIWKGFVVRLLEHAVSYDRVDILSNGSVISKNRPVIKMCVGLSPQ